MHLKEYIYLLFIRIIIKIDIQKIYSLIYSHKMNNYANLSNISLNEICKSNPKDK